MAGAPSCAPSVSMVRMTSSSSRSVMGCKFSAPDSAQFTMVKHYLVTFSIVK
jgi:hypothetical protein